MEEQNAARRPRSSSLPPSPDRGMEGYRPSQLVSPVSINHEAVLTFNPQTPSAKNRVSMVYQERSISRGISCSSTSTRKFRETRSVFLLGKINPGQLMMLPEAELVWEITFFKQSWMQASRVIPLNSRISGAVRICASSKSS